MKGSATQKSYFCQLVETAMDELGGQPLPSFSRVADPATRTTVTVYAADLAIAEQLFPRLRQHQILEVLMELSEGDRAA